MAFADHSIQSWIVMGMFALYILYMLFMTYTSPAYRQAMNISSAWVFLYMVVLVIAYAIIVSVGVGCAAIGPKNVQLCNLWSWMIAALVVFGVLYTIFMSIKANSVYNTKESFVEEKKH